MYQVNFYGSCCEGDNQNNMVIDGASSPLQKVEKKGAT